MTTQIEDKIKRIMASEMAINTDNYNYIIYLQNNILSVVNHIAQIIKPFCQSVSVDNSINSVVLKFSTTLQTTNIITIEITPDCKLINFDLASGGNFFYDKSFEINEIQGDHRPIVYQTMISFLELRQERLEADIDNPAIQNTNLFNQAKDRHHNQPPE